MARACPICEKTSILGGGYSNRTRATQFNPTGTRRRQPNLQWAKLPAGGPIGANKRIKICTRCMKSGRHLKAASS